MKKYLNKIILLVTVAVFPVASYGQYCNQFHTKYCNPSENDMFKFNGQSKGALFGKGQTSELNIIVYKKQDYRISLCMDENLGSQIKFKVYETKKVRVEKVVDEEKVVVIEKQKLLLYDNSQDGFSNEIEFSVESTKRLILEVTVPGGGGESTKGSKKGKKLIESDMGCIGVLVEHMLTPKTGFGQSGF